MTSTQTTMDDAPLLHEPLPEPDPAPGCASCRQWGEQRTIAREEGDWTWVSDCNVRMRRCVH